jgi:beta-glucanase (GH16 family)
LLVIESRRERVRNTEYDANRSDWQHSRRHADYTSASIHTRGKHRWLYGRFDMRARFDVRPGLWPAFWTLGEARAWPGCGEIDIMEFYDGKLLANAAWQGRRRYEAAWDSTERPLGKFNDSAWAEKFHDWRMDWDHDRIRLYVDNELLNEIDVAAATNDDRERARPFREPHYILLNLAIGGTRGGDPSATTFPARFEVDYVRVFQRAKDRHALSTPTPQTSDQE